MRIYLAGPMTGIPQFNIPAFDRAAARLRGFGYHVINPAEEDTPAVRAAGLASIDGKLDEHGMIGSKTWGDLLARDVKIVADDIDAVVLLPGWMHSRGARLEAFVAILCRKPLYQYSPGDDRLAWVSPLAVMVSLHHNCMEDILDAPDK